MTTCADASAADMGNGPRAVATVIDSQSVKAAVWADSAYAAGQLVEWAKKYLRLTIRPPARTHSTTNGSSSTPKP